MSKIWHKTDTDSDVEKFSSEFWSAHRRNLDIGEFWADRIKKLTDEPLARLQLALDNLPLPASFREAIIAVRALIRVKHKNSENYQDELTLLYWLAAINSFSSYYSEVLREPGYNILESIPGNLVKNLPFSYHQLGYKSLWLLNKTDIKWIVEIWGEADNHSTLKEIHNNIWSEYELKLLNKRKNKEAEFKKSLLELLNPKQLNSLP